MLEKTRTDCIPTPTPPFLCEIYGTDESPDLLGGGRGRGEELKHAKSIMIIASN